MKWVFEKKLFSLLLHGGAATLAELYAASLSLERAWNAFRDRSSDFQALPS